MQYVIDGIKNTFDRNVIFKKYVVTFTGCFIVLDFCKYLKYNMALK